MLTATAASGAQSERWGKKLKIRGADLAQCRQQRSNTKAHRKGIEPGFAPGKGLRQQPLEYVQRCMDSLNASAHPAQHTRQLDIGTQLRAGRLQALGLLDGDNDCFDLGQGATQACSQTVRQQAEGAMFPSAAPSGDAGSGRGQTWIGPVAHEPAPALGV